MEFMNAFVSAEFNNMRKFLQNISVRCVMLLILSMPAETNCYCLKHSAPYWSNPSVLIFDIRALWRSGLSARVPECQESKLMS